MRATLEQLKAMSDTELGNHWYAGKFPFDVMKECGSCLASHRVRACRIHGDISTPPFAASSSSVDAIGACLRPHLEEYLAARLFYDLLYPQTAEAAEEKTIAELAPSLVAQG